MSTISPSISRIGLAALGLWMTVPVMAQSPAPGYVTTYFNNAYLDAGVAPAAVGPAGASGGFPQSQAPHMGPGGFSTPGYPGAPNTSGQAGPGAAPAPVPGAGQPGGAGVTPRPTTPGAPTAPPTPTPNPPPEPAPTNPPPTTELPNMSGSFSPGEGGALGGAQGVFNMIGDQSPFSIRQAVSLPQPPTIPPPTVPGQPPRLPNPHTRSLLAPSVRGLKIADNQSPFPQDRVFFSFNYFYNVNSRLNRDFQTPIDNIAVYRYVFGAEKTFAQGMGSLGFLLPLNSVNADTRKGLVNQGGTSTALGDLTLYAKYVLAYNRRTGDVISTGLAVTPPTGPPSFANAPYLKLDPSLHTTELQPFLGYYFNRGGFFLQGFSALSVPVNFLNPLMLYNDIGIGYFLRRDNEWGHIVTAIAPVFETHVNTPLNHRDAFNLFDKAATPDVVNLTFGLNVEFLFRSVLTLGIVESVTGPRPFDLEAVALLNIRFGKTGPGAPRGYGPGGPAGGAGSPGIPPVYGF